jgi:uncharacterized protein (DUF1800 family)
MTFGARQSDIAYFNGLGANNDARLQNYVDEQLDWASINDSAFQALIPEMGFDTLDKTLGQQWQDHHVNNLDRSRPARHMERFMVARALHSKRQLLESLTDFWHNHFNVYLYDFYAQSTFVSWDRDVIRPPVAGHPRPTGFQNGHLMGNFRQLLELSSRHVAMQYFLDNYINFVGGPNENYAREVMELHTLGAENYLPLAAPGDIPTTAIPLPWGSNGSDIMVQIADRYTDDDVYAAMRMMTGWKIKDREGQSYSDFLDNAEFFFYEPWHDKFEKTILGNQWGNNEVAPNDISEFFDILAFHPGTARHIAGKLCRRFISHNPPQSVINEVAGAFYANRYASDQLERTYRALLNSDAFKDPLNWGTIKKRPSEALISALRVGESNWVPTTSDPQSWDIINRYMGGAGNRPFYWRAPDGFPMDEQYWLSGNSLMYVLRGYDFICDRDNGNGINALLPILHTSENASAAELPDYSPNELTSFWLTRVLGYTPAGGWEGTGLHTQITDFMAQSPSDASLWPKDAPFPDISSNGWPFYFNERLRGLVKLVLAAPEFQYR